MNPINAIQNNNPYSYYEELTIKRPFYFDDELNLWVASNAAALRAVFAAPKMRVRPLAQPIPQGLINTKAGEVFGQLVRMRDDEYHQTLKPVVMKALALVDLKKVRSLAQSVTNAHLDQNKNINQLLFSVPATVVATLCGFIPENSAQKMASLIAEFVLCIPATATIEQQNRANQAAKQLLSDFSEQIKNAQEGTLLISLLQTAAEAKWSQNAPLIANAIGFLSQTYDATAGLIGNTLLAAQNYPEIFATNTLDAFVQEVARFDAPIQNTRRFAAETFVYNEHFVQQGQTVLLLLAAGNRDLAFVENPHRLMPERVLKNNFSFGNGAHCCPGMDLAQTIVCGVMETLLKNRPNWIKQLERARYLPSGNARIPEFII